jgi:hypothetical protein
MDTQTIQLYLFYLASLLIAIFVGATTQLTSTDPTMHMLALRYAIDPPEEHLGKEACL